MPHNEKRILWKQEKIVLLEVMIQILLYFPLLKKNVIVLLIHSAEMSKIECFHEICVCRRLEKPLELKQA